MSALGWIGAVGLALVLVGWLAVCFQVPGRRRDTVAWVGALGIYIALLSLFVHLTRRSLADDSTPGIVGFGFLAIFFAVGLVLAVVKLFGSLRARASSDVSATS